MSTALRTAPPAVSEDPRGLRVVEWMALVAAVAFALAWLRTVWGAWTKSPPTSGLMLARLVLDLIHEMMPGLAVATLVVFFLSWRPPRPTFRKGAREPGRLACGVAACFLVAAFAGSLAMAVVVVLTGGPYSASTRIDRLLDGLSGSLDDWGHLIGLSVLVAWVVLGFIRGWRCEPTWADRLGRLVGWGWVVLAPLGVGLRLVVELGFLL
jgi:hypothetical protein